VETVVLLNLPHGVLTSIVQFGYMFALVLSIPLNFLPGARILELWAFGIGKKSDHFGASSSLRLSSMAVCALLAIKGGENFDKLLALSSALPLEVVQARLVCYGSGLRHHCCRSVLHGPHIGRDVTCNRGVSS